MLIICPRKNQVTRYSLETSSEYTSKVQHHSWIYLHGIKLYFSNWPIDLKCHSDLSILKVRSHCDDNGMFLWQRQWKKWVSWQQVVVFTLWRQWETKKIDLICHCHHSVNEPLVESNKLMNRSLCKLVTNWLGWYGFIDKMISSKLDYPEMPLIKM